MILFTLAKRETIAIVSFPNLKLASFTAMSRHAHGNVNFPKSLQPLKVKLTDWL